MIELHFAAGRFRSFSHSCSRAFEVPIKAAACSSCEPEVEASSADLVCR
jgi:hypothetical protein